jgi:peptidylprolyl isomerase
MSEKENMKNIDIEKVEERLEDDELENETEVVKEPEEKYFDNMVNNGDFIKLEMTGMVQETGEIFETTDRELAEQEGLYKENRDFNPRLIIVGEGFVLRGLDNKLRGIAFDKEIEIVIPPEEAFGERDVSRVEIIPYRILRSKGINPIVGSELEIDGRSAIIRSVGAGRVQVDYNHPLAGRTIIYKVKVIEHITKDKEKWKALISRRLVGIESDKFKFRKTKRKLRISIPDEMFFIENIQIAKRGVALDILRYFEDIDTIEFLETIKRS